MIFRTRCEGARSGHEIEAEIRILGGSPGHGPRWDCPGCPPESPEAEVVVQKRMQPDGTVKPQCLVWLVRGKRARLLPMDVADAVAFWLLDTCMDEILCEASAQCETGAEEAAERRWEMAREDRI